MRIRHFALLFALYFALAWALPALGEERTEIVLPDIPGYTTLRCDFHMHTIYSDGTVMPHIRVKEAWRNGLDAMAITDHVEHQHREGDIDKTNLNRSYELAKATADAYHMILIRGGEITREEPHGHFNALFLSDVNPINKEVNEEAVQAAHDQGAFVFWNHPEWKRKDGKAWSDIQAGYIEKGWIQGMEVFNGKSYHPNAHRWCLENGLTMMADTDMHGLIEEEYNPAQGGLSHD